MRDPVTLAVLGALVLLALWFAARWWRTERKGGVADGESDRRLHPIDTLIGFVTNFLDTLGIGSFAPTTAAFKLLRRVPDERIPGTLNVGHALPTIAEALIFIAAVVVEPLTLLSMIGAATAGAWIGVGFVARLPRRAIQIGMGAALLIAAGLFLAGLLHSMPGGGDGPGSARHEARHRGGDELRARGTDDARRWTLCALPDPREPARHEPPRGIPDHDGLLRLLMPVGGARFVASGRYSLRAALGTHDRRHSRCADCRVHREVAADPGTALARRAGRHLCRGNDALVGPPASPLGRYLVEPLLPLFAL